MQIQIFTTHSFRNALYLRKTAADVRVSERRTKNMQAIVHLLANMTVVFSQKSLYRREKKEQNNMTFMRSLEMLVEIANTSDTQSFAL